MQTPVLFTILAIIIGHVSSAPTSASLKDLAAETADDVRNIVDAKVAVVKYGGEAAREAANAASKVASETYSTVSKVTSETVETVSDTATSLLKSTGETASGYISAGGEVAVDFVSNVDPIETLDKTEEQVLYSKDVAIRSIFDAKRALIVALQQLREKNKGTMHAVFNATVSGVNTAIASLNSAIGSVQASMPTVSVNLDLDLDTDEVNATSTSGSIFTSVSDTMGNVATGISDEISVTKEVVADFVNELSLANAKMAVANALNATRFVVESGVSNAINSVVAAKSELQEAAEDFDSAESVENSRTQVVAALNITAGSAESVAEQIGVFSALDALIRSLAQIPKKINSVLIQAQNEVAEAVEVAEADVDVTVREIEEELQKKAEEPDNNVIADIEVTVKGQEPKDIDDEDDVVIDEVDVEVDVQQQPQGRSESMIVETVEIPEEVMAEVDQAQAPAVEDEQTTDEERLSETIRNGDFTEDQLSSVLVQDQE